MSGDNKSNVVGTLVEHPEISFQIVITQKLDGSLEFVWIDHIAKTTAQKSENELTPGTYIEACKEIIEKSKTSFRNVTLFNLKNDNQHP